MKRIKQGQHNLDKISIKTISPKLRINPREELMLQVIEILQIQESHLPISQSKEGLDIV